MEQVQGIGPGLAEKLRERFNVKSVSDLLRPDIYETLPVVTRVFLQYNPLTKIPRSAIENIERVILPVLKASRPTIAGSYRRGEQTSGDIDIVITDAKSWQEIVDKLNTTRYPVMEPYMIGPDRMSTLMQINPSIYVQVDFFMVPNDEYAFMLLYATGSKRFNIRQRKVAKKRGMLLNGNGLYSISTKKPVTGLRSEEDIFNALGMKYLAPNERI